MPPTLRWGILAPGGIAHSFANAVRKHTRQEIVAVGSRSKERADAFADEFDIERRYDSYGALVADEGVDAIYIASAQPLRGARDARNRGGQSRPCGEGLHSDRRRGPRGCHSGARSRSHLHGGHVDPLPPHIHVVRQLLADGALGDIEVVEADHGQYFDFDPESRLFNPALAGGAMLDLGVYPVSFSSFVLGTPSRVLAVSTRAESGVDRQVSMILDGFDSHAHAHAMVNTTLKAQTPPTATVAGLLARVEIPGAFYTPQRIRFMPRGGEDSTHPLPDRGRQRSRLRSRSLGPTGG